MKRRAYEHQIYLSLSPDCKYARNHRDRVCAINRHTAVVAAFCRRHGIGYTATLNHTSLAVRLDEAGMKRFGSQLTRERRKNGIRLFSINSPIGRKWRVYRKKHPYPLVPPRENLLWNLRTHGLSEERTKDEVVELDGRLLVKLESSCPAGPLPPWAEELSAAEYDLAQRGEHVPRVEILGNEVEVCPVEWWAEESEEGRFISVALLPRFTLWDKF